MSSDHDVLSQSAAYVQGAHVIPVRVPVATLDPARLPQSDQSNSVQQQNELGPRTNVTPGFDDLSEDGIDMSLAGDAKHAAMERRYPQPMRSSVLKEAFRSAASELHQRNDRALLSSVSKPAVAVASSALPSLSSEPSGIDDHSRQQDLVTDEEDMLDLAFDIAQDLSRSRNLTPLVSLSPRKAIGSASPSQTPNQPVSNNSTPISTRKPVSWLTIRNIQWSDVFYEEMQQVLRHGVPQAKNERNKIIKNSIVNDSLNTCHSSLFEVHRMRSFSLIMTHRCGRWTRMGGRWRTLACRLHTRWSSGPAFMIISRKCSTISLKTDIAAVDPCTARCRCRQSESVTRMAKRL